ncbi:phosphoglucomutase [Hypnocyclicus thermotrophus]|uniref:Phosphoglucomutase n=1 Tax=Hypnocyclicus thermotrophus TaxID=1627895 RepID=A0AA46DYQ7_9FUSO|nr:phospho-sugar mutase [Hypnocyclicus thermotrophus]TDT70577.1 phosphoglucomutase [Hypnocyclicus thermotrophus]
MGFIKKYEEWLNSSFIDDIDKKELESIKDNKKEIEERFYTDLAFGTGGMRGIRGIGTNRMNKYMIRKATQGLANYMLSVNEKEAKEKGVVIAYDCRIGSVEYSLNAALVLAANGIKSYLFESLRSTPELSFAVRELGTQAGIVVTASHNPVEYNGYKVYWNDGAQIVEPHASGVVEAVKNVKDFGEIKLISEKEAKEKGLLVIVGKELDDKYIETIKKEVINMDIPGKEEFKIVYSPLHGTGRRPVQRILDEVGFKNVYTVKEQEEPDGTFPTVGYANPEDPAVFKLGIKLAEEKGAEIVMANDPDADRIGIAVKDENGKWIYPNGNQVGLLLVEYILANRKNIPTNGKIITTVVSTPMVDVVAKAHNIEVMKTLTGFKFIGEKIRQFETKELDGEYIFGFEESYGYLIGTHARDKDAVVTTMIIAEMAAFYAAKGSSIAKELKKLYEKFGWYKEGIKAITMSGKEGAEKITSIMTKLRENTPTEINGKKVVILRDFDKQIEINKKEKTEKALELPKSNVLQLVLEDNTYITARPSGTEPKIKYYFGVNAASEEEVNKKMEKVMNSFLELLD